MGNDGAVAPEQIVVEVPKLKDGVTTGFTVTVKTAVRAHCPASGVKVYVPEFRLSTLEGLSCLLYHYLKLLVKRERWLLHK